MLRGSVGRPEPVSPLNYKILKGFCWSSAPRFPKRHCFASRSPRSECSSLWYKRSSKLKTSMEQWWKVTAEKLLPLHAFFTINLTLLRPGREYGTPRWEAGDWTPDKTDLSIKLNEATLRNFFFFFFTSQKTYSFFDTNTKRLFLFRQIIVAYSENDMKYINMLYGSKEAQKYSN